jgi:hypothetical protein
MKNATRIFTSTFGAIMALAGIEHGVGEVLQGNNIPSGLMILSWPDSAFFRNVGGEPAMTVIPNLLISGILTIIVSMVMLLWALLFIHKKNGSLVMILISIALLLVGGGLFPPFLGIVIGFVAKKIHSPFTWWQTHLSKGLRRFLSGVWPWAFVTCAISFPAMLVGVGLLGYFFAVDDTNLLLIILCYAMGSFLLTILTGFARDASQKSV